MTADDYLTDLLTRIKAPTGARGPGDRVRNELLPYMREWAGAYLQSVDLSGSYAKHTAVKGDSDVDLFVSLSDKTPGTLAELYTNLGQFMEGKRYAVRWQNVSIGISHGGLKVDLVPGRRQSSWSNDHSLYVSKRRTWTKTNIATHIQTVTNSRRGDEICLLKRWRDVHKLELPSFCLELATINALSGYRTGALAHNFLTALDYFRDRLPSAVLQDPANSNNDVADDLTRNEKRAISDQAAASINEPSWGRTVW